jgi:hypothetical protein
MNINQSASNRSLGGPHNAAKAKILNAIPTLVPTLDKSLVWEVIDPIKMPWTAAFTSPNMIAKPMRLSMVLTAAQIYRRTPQRKASGMGVLMGPR